jgi:hypothetical protein
MDNCASFEAMVGDGKYHPFACLGNNEFVLSYSRYEAVEDPSDGYRSCLGAVNRAFGDDYYSTVAEVTITYHDEEYKNEYDGTYRREVYKLTDRDGHVWLMFGTDNSDDYYPCFVFEYQPKPPSTP